jgi:hypothetical protein
VVSLARNSLLPMAATFVKFLIVKSMTTRAIQTQCDPQHQAEYQESEHKVLPRFWEAPPPA